METNGVAFCLASRVAFQGFPPHRAHSWITRVMADLSNVSSVCIFFFGSCEFDMHFFRHLSLNCGDKYMDSQNQKLELYD
jgi:hypothetical protein